MRRCGGLQFCWVNAAISFSLPLFLLFVLASFKTEMHVTWTAPAFLSLAPAAAVGAPPGGGAKRS